MTKSEIKQLQRSLRETTAPTTVVDGVYGKQTTKAIEEFADVHGIDVEAAKVLLNRYADLRFVSDEAFTQAAKTLAVKESYVRAIAEVESAGESFLKDGRIKILFERHWFYRKLKEAMQRPEVLERVAAKLNVKVPTGPSAATTMIALVVRNYEDICSSARGGYKGGEAEWIRLNLAMEFDIEAACQSTSFGGYQIMGFNHKASGFNTAKDMMLEMAKSESKQFLALVEFIKTNPKMHTALKNGNLAGFAEAYNGPSYRENNYDSKLAKAESKWSAVVTA